MDLTHIVFSRFAILGLFIGILALMISVFVGLNSRRHICREQEAIRKALNGLAILSIEEPPVPASLSQHENDRWRRLLVFTEEGFFALSINKKLEVKHVSRVTEEVAMQIRGIQ